MVGDSNANKNSVVAVTGGATGLGEATVRKSVSGDGKAVILDLSDEKGQLLVEEFGESVHFIKMDVTDEASVQAALDEAVETFGSIDAL